VVVRKEDACVGVYVTDHGRGIPPAAGAHVFVPYSQLEAADATRGSGLGLSISKELVDRMGGTIGYTSTPGVTTTFFACFPELET